MSKVIDIAGQRFGRLVAFTPTSRRAVDKSIIWVCTCDCGEQCEVPSSSLRNRNTKSCGCLKRETNRTNGRNVGIKSGGDRSRERIARSQYDGQRKTCSKCLEIRELTDFYTKITGVGGRHSQCKACLRKRQLVVKYGITFEDFQRLEALQVGRCAICNDAPDESLAVDHCHSTGRIRGLLCRACNMALGAFRDKPENLISAAAYLQQQVPRE